MSDLPISQELVERAFALVREAGKMPDNGFCLRVREEASAIVALLSKPVDPDLIEARAIAEDTPWFSANQLAALRSGGHDDAMAVKVILKAIKRGRTLQREEQS